MAALRSRDGKATPSKSELAVSSALEAGGRTASSQLMSSAGPASLLCSQLSAGPRWAYSQQDTLPPPSKLSKSGRQSGRLSRALDSCRRRLGPAVRAQPTKPAARELRLMLRSCRSSEVAEFRLYCERELALNEALLAGNIVQSVSAC